MADAHRVIAMFAFFLICASAAPTVPEQLEKWQQGRRIEVVLKTGDTIVGRLGPLQKEGFLLVSEKRGQAERLVRFDEIQSVTTKMATSTKVAIAIIIWAPLVIMSLILGK